MSGQVELATNDLHNACMALRLEVAPSIANDVSAKAETVIRLVNTNQAAIHAAHGLLSPLGNQVTPSVLAIREALNILRSHL